MDYAYVHSCLSCALPTPNQVLLLKQSNLSQAGAARCPDALSPSPEAGRIPHWEVPIRSQPLTVPSGSLISDHEAVIRSGYRAVGEPDARLLAWLISVLGSGEA
jgi:hypothetical protein